VREQIEALEDDADLAAQRVDVDARAGDPVAMRADLAASIGSSPLMQRSSVDLPQPDGPIRQTT
jgi:hypothetical protein